MQAICTSMILVALVSTVEIKLVPAFQRSANAHQLQGSLVSTRTGFCMSLSSPCSTVQCRSQEVCAGDPHALDVRKPVVDCGGGDRSTSEPGQNIQALDVLPALDGPPPGSESGPLSHGNGKYTKERVIRGTCGLFYCGDSAMWSAEQPRGMHVASSKQQVGWLVPFQAR